MGINCYFTFKSSNHFLNNKIKTYIVRILLNVLYTHCMNEIIQNLSIDIALFGFKDKELQVLLIKRDKQPEMDRWSLPGGYVFMDEDISDAAKRILVELTGISNLYLSQVELFGSTSRYPGKRVVSVLYCALISPEKFDLIAGSYARQVNWFSINGIMQLPFDHNEMISTAMRWFNDELWRKPIFINLLPEKFPLNLMMNLFNEFLGESIDNRNFRKKVINQGLVEKLDEKTQGGVQRPAFLYKLKRTI